MLGRCVNSRCAHQSWAAAPQIAGAGAGVISVYATPAKLKQLSGTCDGTSQFFKQLEQACVYIRNWLSAVFIFAYEDMAHIQQAIADKKSMQTASRQVPPVPKLKVQRRSPAPSPSSQGERAGGKEGGGRGRRGGPLSSCRGHLRCQRRPGRLDQTGAPKADSNQAVAAGEDPDAPKV